jgi:hypothetical protein
VPAVRTVLRGERYLSPRGPQAPRDS